ncbi:hypothetical protein BJV77DRAFT_962771 [Russula vinacea]|nr:hypothetical protein BJV77DRAFT_962771 [Russula vinacea]
MDSVSGSKVGGKEIYSEFHSHRNLLIWLRAPHNGPVLDSISWLASQELLSLSPHPAASWVLDAIIDGPTIPLRSRRALLRAMAAQIAGVIDDRIGVQVGARCWAAADSYFKLCRVFLVTRRPNDWQLMLGSLPRVAAAYNASGSGLEAAFPRGNRCNGGRINAVFADAIGRKVVRSAPEVPDPAPAPTPVKSGTKKANLALKQEGDKATKALIMMYMLDSAPLLMRSKSRLVMRARRGAAVIQATAESGGLRMIWVITVVVGPLETLTSSVLCYDERLLKFEAISHD